MSPVDKLLSIALAEEGYLEKKTNSQLDDKTANAGKNNYTKYGRDLDTLGFYNGKKNGYSWCDQFVDWNFVQAFGMDLALQLLCQPIKSLGAGCKYSAQYYKKKGQLFFSPQKGDQIFFGKKDGSSVSHTGLVYNVDSKYVYTIEGNTSSATGVVANGGCVRKKKYVLNDSKIYAYGRPNWSLVSPEKKVEEEEEVTQEQFNKMMDTYIDQLAKEPLANWQQADMVWAQQQGLILGDEHGNVMPQKFLTRAEAAIILHRLAQKLK